MNKVLVFFIVVIFVINAFILDGIMNEIKTKKEKIEQIEKEVYEYNFIRENEKINKIMKKNKVIKKYTYVEATKEVLQYFKKSNVLIKSVDFSKEKNNQVRIKMEITTGYNTLTDIIDQIKKTEALIIINSLQMRAYKNNRYSCKIILKRVYNI